MSRTWRWRRAETVLFREVLDDVVLLVPGPEPEPFALAGGAALWRLLAQARTTVELMADATAGMTVQAGGQAELETLLSRLADAGAVDRVPV
jgi:hypothetical protein